MYYVSQAFNNFSQHGDDHPTACLTDLSPDTLYTDICGMSVIQTTNCKCVLVTAVQQKNIWLQWI